MTNSQIIMNLKEQLGIPEIVPMLTYGEWKKNGYQVKRGEHGVKALLWKHLDGRRRARSESEQQDENEDGYTRKVCYLFLPNQVEKMKEAQ